MFNHTMLVSIPGKGLCIVPTRQIERGDIVVKHRVRAFTKVCNARFHERKDS